MKRTLQSTPAGVTLLELMVVLAVLSILLAAAVPSFKNMLRSQRLTAGTGELLAAIHLARSQAIARNTRVAIAPADPDEDDFARGWVVFVVRNGARQPASPGDIIASHGPMEASIRIGATMSSQHGPSYVAYNGAGRSCTMDNSLAAHWGTLSLSDGAEVRRIKINMLGRARVCNPATARTGCEGQDGP